MRRLLGLLLFSLALILPRLAAAEVGVGPWTHTANADLRLIAAQSTVGDTAALSVGLHFVLKPGWKIYWRSPGDAGYPPSLTWTGSSNLRDVDIAWPAPHRFSTQGIETAGYEGTVVLPLTVHLRQPKTPLNLTAAVDFLICSEICVPGHGTVTLALPAGPPQMTSAAALISQYAGQVPNAGPDSGLSLGKAVIEPNPDGAKTSDGSAADPVLAVVIKANPPLTAAPDLFVEGKADGAYGMIAGAPTITLQEGGRQAVIRAPLTHKPDTPDLTLTVVAGARAVEIKAAPRPGVLDDNAGGPPLLAILAVALLGGLILNLMPCVLPVLSLKLLAVLRHDTRDRRAVRTGFLASAGGIIATFLAMALVLAGLKAAGLAVGWGIQFQQPVFLGVMAVVLVLFTANLWGLFEIPLPGFLSRSGGDGREPSLWGHAAMGAFATLLATPCSAPFLGTAVGFALARGPVEIVLVFLCLGIGMAAPYLAVAAVPAAARLLPRPGHWMITLRRVLGLALAGTAVWLAGVLAIESGWWMPASAAATATRIPWQAFDPTALPPPSGQVVFVDVTADWCLTCKVNQATVIDRDPVARALSDPSVTAVKADWTRPNPAIAAYLKQFGRYGIPFNVVYGPGAPDGIALPEILTTDTVLSALKTASLKTPASTP